MRIGRLTVQLDKAKEEIRMLRVSDVMILCACVLTVVGIEE